MRLGDGDEDEPTKELDITWLPGRDVFTFCYNPKIAERPIETPRDVVSISAFLYDPNGYVSLYVLFSRQMLQSSCLGDIGWDSPLDPELRREFIKWSSSIPLLANLEIPRWWNSGVDGIVDEQLHIFCDAAATGYGAIGYRQVRGRSGKIIRLKDGFI